jgi:hypothetical protein
MHWARFVGGCLFALAGLVFLSFFVATLILGGDALNGKVEGDRYFLSWGGEYTEVSEGVYRYSRAHGISMLVIFPLGVIGAGILLPYADRVEKRRIAARLREREPLTAPQFAERFFGPDMHRIELAAALRDILEEEVDIDLAGLRPDDRLDYVSRGAISSDPFLFMEIEDRLGVDTGVQDLARLEQAVQRITTFENLVDYVANCPKKEKTALEEAEADLPRGGFVTGLERVMGFVFGRGFFVLFALIVLGILAHSLGFPAVGNVLIGGSVSALGLAVVSAGLWLWMLALTTFRLRRKEGRPVGAWLGLLICGAAGTLVGYVGIGIIVGIFAHLPG